MRIDCEAIPAACPRVGTSGTMVLDTHGSQTGDQEMVVSGVKSKAVEPVTSYQPQAGVTGDFETANVGSDGIPSAQQVLNLIAVTFLKRDDMSDTEKSNGFIDYMEGARKVLIVDTQPGSLVITVECGSLKILDDLWDDYRTGHLHEMAQKYLVTDDILKTFGLVEVKLKTTIEEKDYRAAREYFLEALGEYVQSCPGEQYTLNVCSRGKH